MTDPIDFDGLVEMGARAAYEDDAGDPRGVPWEELWDPVKAPYREDARAILTAVLPRVLAGPREALGRVSNAKALAGVRDLVAGWNGENRPDGPYTERHPSRLGATLPKTNCGAVYELDEALVNARAELARIDKLTEGM